MPAPAYLDFPMIGKLPTAHGTKTYATYLNEIRTAIQRRGILIGITPTLPIVTIPGTKIKPTFGHTWLLDARQGILDITNAAKYGRIQAGTLNWVPWTLASVLGYIHGHFPTWVNNTKTITDPSDWMEYDFGLLNPLYEIGRASCRERV